MGRGDWTLNFPGNMHFDLRCMAFFNLSSCAINVRTSSGRVRERELPGRRDLKWGKQICQAGFPATGEEKKSGAQE